MSLLCSARRSRAHHVCTIYGMPSGSAQLQTSGLAIGSYNFTVALSNGVATRSASATLNVEDFSATLSDNTPSVAVGQNGQVNVTSQNAFADTVSLYCSGAPSGTNCTINPNSVTPTSAGTPARISVAVSSKPAASRGIGRTLKQYSALTALLMGAVGIVLTVPSRRRRVLPGVAVFVRLGLSISCSGGSSGGGGGGGGGAVGGGGSMSFNLTIQARADGVTKNIGTIKVTVP